MKRRLILFALVFALLASGSGAAYASGGGRDVIDIAVSSVTTVGLRADGTVAAVGDNSFGQCEVGRWTDIVAVVATSEYTVGLRADGTLVGTECAPGCLNGSWPAGKWRAVKAIAGSSQHLVALCSDGTVLAVGEEGCESACDVSGLENISRIYAGICPSCWYTLCLGSDGRVTASKNPYYEDMDSGRVWFADKVVDVSSSGWLNLALRSDGTVSGSGADYGLIQQELSKWKGITQVLASNSTALGLKADGTVTVVSRDSELVASLSKWKGIRELFANSSGAVVGLGESTR